MLKESLTFAIGLAFISCIILLTWEDMGAARNIEIRKWFTLLAEMWEHICFFQPNTDAFLHLV